jgi:hypothetical protein
MPLTDNHPSNPRAGRAYWCYTRLKAKIAKSFVSPVIGQFSYVRTGSIAHRHIRQTLAGITIRKIAVLVPHRIPATPK